MLNQTVASHVVETLTGQWLGDFLHEKIWTPLGMNGTYFSTPAALAAPELYSQGYVYYQDKFQEVPYMDLDIVSGAGSVISNVLSYTKWIQALLAQSGPISKDAYKALFTPRTLIEPYFEDGPYTGVQSYALGWIVGVYRGYEYFEHSGGMEAFGTQLIFFPKLRYGAVTFANTASTSNSVGQKLIFHLLDEKLGVPEEERFDWDKQYVSSLPFVRVKSSFMLISHI